MTALSRRSGIGPFVGFRTEPLPTPKPRTDGRRCQSCNCLLASDNRTDTCAPCSFGEVVVPGWATYLIGIDPSPTTVSTVAGALGVAPKPLRARPGDLAARDAEMLQLHEGEGVSQYRIAHIYGVTRSAVVCAIERERRRVEQEKGRSSEAARQYQPTQL